MSAQRRWKVRMVIQRVVEKHVNAKPGADIKKQTSQLKVEHCAKGEAIMTCEVAPVSTRVPNQAIHERRALRHTTPAQVEEK